MLYEKTIESPVGELHLVASDRGLRHVGFENSDRKYAGLNEEITPSDTHKILNQAEKELNEYFNGLRKEFNVALDLVGTVFQTKAWQALCQIPYGQTATYGQQAEKAGNKTAARAIGGANNRNPVCIIVPCHRVVGSDGSLVGYAGGMKRKEYLLHLETRASQKKAS